MKCHKGAVCSVCVQCSRCSRAGVGSRDAGEWVPMPASGNSPNDREIEFADFGQDFGGELE